MSDEERDRLKFAMDLVLWIKTAREAGYGGEDWWPTSSDIVKSSLLARIRRGEQPLPEPPPTNHSYPWYSVVEEPGPHHVGSGEKGVHFGAPGHPWMQPDQVVVNQSVYEIVERRGDHDVVVRDSMVQTSYRFRLWFDPDWEHPTAMKHYGRGGWFMQNVEFES